MNYCDCKVIDGELFEQLVYSGAGKLRRNIREINDLNVFPIPDGDTGDNMFRTISGGVREMSKEPDGAIGKKAQALAVGMLLNARGNSGVILSQLFSGMSSGLEGVHTATMQELGCAFAQGVKRAYETVVTPVEGTILTVAREAVDEVSGSIDRETTLGTFSERFVERMKTSLENTPELLDVLKNAGVVDSGGAGLFMIAEGAAEAIHGQATEFEEGDAHPPASELNLDLFTEDSKFEFGYCTEFLLRLMRAKVDLERFDENVIVSYLETIGDSIVAFREGSIVKVHVHTMTPSKALAFCQRFGEFLTVKIENMMLQHNEHEQKKQSLIPKVQKARAKYASCVVTSGSGIMDVLREMGADCIIEGGQGKNPAIRDFLDAFDRMNADTIFVFPNNSNILMAAEQAAKLYRDAKVYVIPSRNIGQAYAALSMLDYSLDTPEAVYENFVQNMECVETGMVTRAIRSVDYAELSVRSGDYIGFTNKEVLCTSTDKTEALGALCRKLAAGGKEIATVIYGADASEQDRELVRSLFSTQFRKMEFYEIDGKQELYDYIIILES